ncbi:hypothetical protein P8452_22933 [Trifolium repens]|nr:hypothetical protein P8452_22933 [Trifolium repens]
MREKQERRAPVLWGAAVRLTEFETERRDGFVNRLNKETTSFFFTNYPAETQVMDLWKLFAKYGRVGEVYIPKKLDKQGNKFGFVKYKEVNNVEELSDRLADVWIGTYKLRVNLSRYGRKGSKTSASPVSAPLANRRVEGSSSGLAKSDKSFRTALVGVVPETAPVTTNTVGEPNGIPILDAEVEEDFLQTLIGSYVGCMCKGVEVRALQMKLSMAGLQAVKVSAMGGRLVLLSSGSDVHVGAPICNIQWWGDLLEDIKPWTPNLVGTTRKLWLRLYGVPLHAWGLKFFQEIASRCGVFIAMDSVTASQSRFDVARISIDSSLLGFIDFVIKIRIQGALFKVRVVEEGEGPREFENLSSEDQLEWNAAASSCHSGEGERPAVAMLGGLDGDESEGEDSVSCQQEVGQRLQGAVESTGGICILEKRVGKPLDNPTLNVSIPSIAEKEMATGEGFVSGESSGDKEAHLLEDVCMEDVGRGGQLDVGPEATCGDGCIGPLVGPSHSKGVDTEEPRNIITQFNNIPLIENFDSMIKKSRGKHPPPNTSDLSEEESLHPS